MKKLPGILTISLIITLSVLGLLLIPSFQNSNSVVHSQDQPKNNSLEPKYISDTLLVKLNEEQSNTLRSKLTKVEKENTPSKKELDLTKSESKDTGISALTQIAEEENFKKIETTFAADEPKNIKEQAKESKETLKRWYTIKLNTESKEIKKDSDEYKNLEKIAGKLRKIEGVENVNFSVTVHPQFTPNDTYYSSQWAPVKIGANTAWDITTGSGVTVAVLDTGIKADHEDLTGKVYNQVDFTGSSYGTADLHGHGTAVAGIIDGNINNSKGIAGISPGVYLLNIKTGYDGTGSSSTNILDEAIEWAVDHDANVINMSLGADWDCDSTRQDMIDAINYAYANDVVIVAAAGNDGHNDVDFPANCNHVISVTGTNSRDAWAGYNYGTAVDIAAPTKDIYTTSKDGLYELSFGGTSAATPHIAAVAALIKSVNPTFTADQVTTRLLTTADPITDTWVKWSNGRVNARRAVSPPTGTITATANPCQLAVGASTCTSTISWSTGNNPDYVWVGVRENPGTYLSTGVNSGSVNVNWITTSGATFDLYSNLYFIGSVHVTANLVGTISANPKPCNLNGGSTCNSTLTWSTVAGTPNVTVKNRQTGATVASGGSGTTSVTVNSTGNNFDLYSGTTYLYSNVFVKGQ